MGHQVFTYLRKAHFGPLLFTESNPLVFLAAAWQFETSALSTDFLYEWVLAMPLHDLDHGLAHGGGQSQVSS